MSLFHQIIVCACDYVAPGPGGGGGGGYPGVDPHMQQGGYGRGGQRMGARGDMGGEYGMAGPMGGVGGGPRMGHGPGMGRGGGMYEVVEQDLGDGNVYHVQFKRSTRNFLLGKTCQRDLQVRGAMDERQANHGETGAGEGDGDGGEGGRNPEQALR